MIRLEDPGRGLRFGSRAHAAGRHCGGPGNSRADRNSKSLASNASSLRCPRMTRATAQPIAAVLFDLGGTLTDGRDFQGWAEDARSLGLDVTPETLARAWESVQPWLNRREDSPDALWRDVLSDAAATEVSADVVFKFIDRQGAKPIYGSLFSDVRRCLGVLDHSRKRMGIVSNSRSEPAVRALLRNFNLEATFDTVVSSGTEGIRKPDSEIFRRALNRMGVAAQTALFVGDDVENDYNGAISAGLHAVWLNRAGTGVVGGVPEILSLSEVPRVVRLLEAGAPVK